MPTLFRRPEWEPILELDPNRLLHLEIPARSVEYSDRDTLLYALSLGAGLSERFAHGPRGWATCRSELRPSASIEDRLSAPLAVAPELCFCNMGSMNFGAYAMKEKYQGKWRYDWEEDYLETSRGAIIEGLTREIASPDGVRAMLGLKGAAQTNI